MRGLVRTVRGDVEPRALGVTDAHDHLLMASPAIAGIGLDDERAAVGKAQAFQAAGGGALVQWTPPGMGRRAGCRSGIAEQAGIHLVAATGLHQARYYATDDDITRWPATLDSDDLAALFVQELTEGMRHDDGTQVASVPVRAGAIKVAGRYHNLDQHEQKALAAAGAAHRITGAPVCVHLEFGTHGPAVLEALAQAGVSPERVILGHLARNPDAQLHAELAATGAFLAYDGPRRDTHATDWRLGDLLCAMFQAGHGAHILLGADTLSDTPDSPRAVALLHDTAARLARHVGEKALQAVLIENPARAFAWTSHQDTHPLTNPDARPKSNVAQTTAS